MASKREKREKRRSAREATNRRLANHNQGFESTTVDLPQNVDRFSVKEAKPIRGDILNYTVGKDNPYADEGELHWERTFYIHKNIGPDRKSYVCPEIITGGRYSWPGYASGGKVRCPICREILRLHNEDSEENKDLIKSLKLQERQLINWKPVGSETVYVWDVSHFPLGDLIDTKLRNDEDDEYQDFSDWEKGLNVRVIFEEAPTGDGKTWFKPKEIEFKNRKEPLDADSIKEKVHCLDDFIKVLEPDELKRIFLQTDEDESETENKSNFKESDVKKIKNMTEKELKKFCAINDIDIDWDDLETLDEMRDAVIEIVKEAIADEAGGKKAAKKASKKVAAKDEDEDDEDSDDDDSDDDEEDDDSEEDESDDDDEEDSDDDNDDSDDDNDDSDDDDEEDDDEEDSDDDEEEDDDEDEPPAKTKKKVTKKAKK